MFNTVFFILQNRFMPDIEQVILFRHCTRTSANRCRRFAAFAAKKLAGCARESRRLEEDLNWPIQGCNVASHLDNLHATVGEPLRLDIAQWNVYNFRSRFVFSQKAELPRCASSLPRQRKRRRGGKKCSHVGAAPTRSY